MKRVVFFIFIFLWNSTVEGQGVKVEVFGDTINPAVIFLHGGPGYNSVLFERTTAANLAEQGFFVISYDRRGEGRSEQLKAKYTFEETINDLDSLFLKFNRSKATLIGHSFGGVVGTLFAEQCPEKIDALILVGAPVDLQETFKTIIAKSKQIYTQKEAVDQLKYIDMLEEMDTSSLMYGSYCFMHAMQNGFYSTKTPNQKAQAIFNLFKTDEVLKKYASKMDYAAPQGFWKNEQYTTLSLKENLKKLKKLEIKVFGLYGMEDGLYTKQQIEELKQILGVENVKYLEDCSHNVFIDQQDQFIEALKSWTK